MRLLCCGDRFWTDSDLVLRVIQSRQHEISLLIQGECRGADTLAKDAAYSLNISIDSYPALWMAFGRGAGPIRNRQMLKEGKPQEVWAFHDDIWQSSGTVDMMCIALRAKIETYLISHKGVWSFDGIADLWLFMDR